MCEQSSTPVNLDAPDDIEEERIVRKSTRTSVIVRQAERDAIRAALQATMKVIICPLEKLHHLLISSGECKTHLQSTELKHL